MGKHKGPDLHGGHLLKKLQSKSLPESAYRSGDGISAHPLAIPIAARERGPHDRRLCTEHTMCERRQPVDGEAVFQDAVLVDFLLGHLGTEVKEPGPLLAIGVEGYRISAACRNSFYFEDDDDAAEGAVVDEALVEETFEVL
eukprot:CAMPEP_0206419796 /NCGR_PEP_ID=MMETSP0324_2-20121206/397_1 /ASSEMBLY_ACC=CAM_ASM_000836 /TAXON_ID=2866 /ORGANISM="Crypthecodinium cohnii, Strain Seligo" /LENGTH=141 /DNA_ID=CAMNT_0053883431 /DNA_START=512 /DNA_END=937 /DNA_ORIENTATION=+